MWTMIKPSTSPKIENATNYIIAYILLFLGRFDHVISTEGREFAQKNSL